MSDSDEFEYESDDDPYGGAEEEAGGLNGPKPTTNQYFAIF